MAIHICMLYSSTVQSEPAPRLRSLQDHQALEAIRKEVNAGRSWVADGDVADFSGSLDHDLLLQLAPRCPFSLSSPLLRFKIMIPV